MTYENLDRKLVNALLGDGRASLRSLADDLDVSVTTVSNHLSTLEEEGIIQGYTPKVDYDKLGYDVTAIVQLTAADARRAEVLDELRAADQYVTVYEVTGEYDVVAVGRFRDTAELNERVGELVTTEGVAEVTTAVVLDTVADDSLSPLRGD